MPLLFLIAFLLLGLFHGWLFADYMFAEPEIWDNLICAGVGYLLGAVTYIILFHVLFQEET